MNNTLVEYGSLCSATELFIEATKKNTYSNYRFKLAKEITNEDINWCDVMIACRPVGYDSYINAVAAKKANVFYNVFYDDDLLNWNESFGLDIKYAKKCIEIADLVSSTSPLIGEEYCKYSKKKRLFLDNTPISKEEIIKTKKTDSNVHFVFAAGSSHEHSFLEYIAPILDVFLDNNQNADISFIGVHPDLSELKNIDRIKYYPGMNLNDYRIFMSTHHFDVGFSPLIDNKFNNCKYFNKYLEYSKVGICGLYSNIKPYTYIIKNYKNGILVNNTPNDWLKSMEEVMDSKLREKIVDCSVKQLEEEFTIEKLIEKQKKEIPEIFEKNYNKTIISFKRNKVYSYLFSCLRRIWLSVFVLKTYGFKEFVSRVKRHL